MYAMLISQSVIYLISLKKKKQPWLNLNDSCKSQTRALTELMKSNAIQCITLATLIIAIKKKTHEPIQPMNDLTLALA